ncbi:MAG: hypothetical protein BroJett018_38960 [Chloroflexota bacterium]|nr:MAG: hypothetical protein BroJett018_38960 [Chloroflexota bacterium]
MNPILKRGITVSFILMIGLLAITPLPRSAHSQNPTAQRIESDDPSVTRAGNWASQATNQASNGSYLYSSGADDDVLTLEFSGSSIEVIFVAGPSLGTLAINVDDTVLRTVITTADQTAYQQSSRIDYLSDEPHTLKVYAQAGGVVGVDAFVVPTSPPDPLSASSEGETSGQTRDPFCAPTNQIHRVSLTSTGLDGDDYSAYPAISSDGRYVAFSSAALLVPADSDHFSDIYVYDRQTCTLNLISTNSDGIKGNDGSFRPSITGDGRYVTFQSYATNLVNNDANNLMDVFVHDRQTNSTTRVSVATGGAEAIGGRSVAPDFAANGRYVSFTSLASNLVMGDTNNTDDTFVHDLQTGSTTRVSVATGGVEVIIGYSQLSSISADGRYVAFDSSASTLVTGDTNDARDIFVHDRQNGTTTRVSVATGGDQADFYSNNPVISDNGRFVTFDSTSTNLVVGDTNHQFDVFLRDMQTGTTSRVSLGTGGIEALGGASFSRSISADGRYIAFGSTATSLALGNTNGYSYAYVHDRQTVITTLVSASSTGALPDAGGFTVDISADGRYVALDSGATNLVSGDTNGFTDAFVTPLNPVFVPTNLTATTLSQTSIQLAWTDNASDETNFTIERSFTGTTDWSQIGSTVANVASFTDTVYLACGTPYYYRVRAYRSWDGVFSGYSNLANANTAPCRPDALALANPDARLANFIHTLTNLPAGGDYSQFATGLPYGPGGQYIMGDWNGDGLDTIGVYREGAFYFTNDFGTGGTWGGIWFGLGGQAVVGRFDATVNHDCLGVTDSGIWTNGDTYFALYFTCNLTSGPTPPLTFQWLSILLPTSQGFTGTFQFVAGDFNGDGVDSVAVRRGNFIAWTNVPPTTVQSQFNLAQYIGAPGTGDEGKVVAGDWDLNQVDSFGLVYQNGTFYRRNDVEWNTGVYILQTFTSLVGIPFDVASWRPN